MPLGWSEWHSKEKNQNVDKLADHHNIKINLSLEQNFIKINNFTNIKIINFVITTQELFDKYVDNFAVFQCLCRLNIYCYNNKKSSCHHFLGMKTKWL